MNKLMIIILMLGMLATGAVADTLPLLAPTLDFAEIYSDWTSHPTAMDALFTQNPIYKNGCTVNCTYITSKALPKFAFTALGVKGETVQGYPDEIRMQEQQYQYGCVSKYIDDSLTGFKVGVPAASSTNDWHLCMMNVDSYTPGEDYADFKQTDPRWGGNAYADGLFKIRNIGCCMCGYANMAYAEDVKEITPGILNEYLKNLWVTSNHKVRGYIGRQVNPYGVIEVLKQMGYHFTFKRDLGVDNALLRGKPVIMSVKNTRHWVQPLAHRHDSDYFIHDPMDRTDDSSDYYGANPSNTRTIYRSIDLTAPRATTSYSKSAAMSILPVANYWGNSYIQVFSNSYYPMIITIKRFYSISDMGSAQVVATGTTEYTDTPEGLAVPMGTSADYPQAPNGNYVIEITTPVSNTYNITCVESDYYGNVKEQRFSGTTVFNTKMARLPLVHSTTGTFVK